MYKDGLLDPKRLSRKVLGDAIIDLGSREYAGQFLQAPEAPGGNIIKRAWIKTFTELPKEKPISIMQSWDTAFKKGEFNAHNVCTTWIEYAHGYYLTHAYIEKLTYPELKQQVIALDARFKPHRVLVEDKATGTPAMQELSNDTRINFVPILPDGDKEQRAHACSPTFEAGNVYIRGNAEWTSLLIDNLCGFPTCKIMDIMDSISQYINYINLNQTYSVKQLRVGKGSNLTQGY